MFLNTKEKPTKERIFDLIHIGIYSLCFIGVTFHLNEVDNMTRQTFKDRQSGIAMVFFLVAVWTMRKVRLINWQSLIVTLLLFPAAFFGVKSYINSPDVFPNTILSFVAYWMVFMVVVDFMVKKKVRKIRTLQTALFVFFCAMTALLAIYSHGSPMPFTYCYFILICLIPMDKKEWRKVLYGVLNAGILSFCVIAFISFLVNPYFGVPEWEFMLMNPHQHGRWYGCFLNIGYFGQYLGLNLALSVGSMFLSGEKSGVFSFKFLLSFLWFAADLFLAVLNGTSNYVVGALVLLGVLFIFGWKDATKKGMIIRGTIVGILLTATVIGTIAGIRYVYSDAFDGDAINSAIQNSALKPVSSGVEYIVDKLVRAQELKDIKENAFPPRSIGRFLDFFSSSRLGISYEFLKQSTFQGTGGDGIQYYFGDYFAYNAHDQYVQILYNYGFLAGGVNILYYLTIWIASIVRYRKTRKSEFFLAMSMLSVMLGMWLGEASGIYASLTFFASLVSLALLWQNDKSRVSAYELITGVKGKQNSAKGQDALLNQNDLNAQNDLDKTTVFCLGSKSIGFYGGYETFMKKLLDYASGGDVRYVVACKANGSGSVDVRMMDGAKRVNESEFLYNGSMGFFVPVHDNYRSAQAIEYDIEALKETIRMIRKYHIEKPVVFIMACRIGPFIKKYVRQIHKLGGKVIINPDGHEWKRGKWSAPVRRYWKISEKKMVKNADVIVCDSVNMEKYIKEEYGKYHPQTTFIAYGAELEPSSNYDPVKLNQNYQDWLSLHGLKEGEYYLTVGRFVPENNFETMIREFMNSDTKKKLAVITTVDRKFYAKLNQKLDFESDGRIKFVGTVYQPDLLRIIRENAYGYIHGHSVGGTNPSLLEALGSTSLNLVYDISFNREVAKDAGLYWTLEEGSLSNLLSEADGLSKEEIKEYAEKAKNRIRTNYTWEFISSRYQNCFTDFVWQENEFGPDEVWDEEDDEESEEMPESIEETSVENVGEEEKNSTEEADE